jgi:hypothetical protein
MKTSIIFALIITATCFEHKLQGAETPKSAKLLRQPSEAASNIVYEGKSYLPHETTEMTRKILAEGDSAGKIAWLRKIMLLTTNLQPQLPDLVSAFHRERDDDVKKSILAAVNYTADPRLLDLCEAVKITNKSNLRIFAGGILIGEKRIAGLELSSHGMESFSREDQRRAKINVTAAAEICGLPFAFDRTKLPPGLDNMAEGQALTVQWVEWWATNKSKYLTNNPAPARK